MAAWFGAVELGGSKALCAVGPSHQDIRAQARIETQGPEPTLRAIERFFAPHRRALRALGVASFGPLELDPQSPAWGSLLPTPKPGWAHARIAPRLAQTLAVPVAIDTDVNAAALAEQRWGSAREADPCVYITVGTGIGVGVVIGGRPLHGLMHPELGHVRALDLCSFEGVCSFHGRCVEGLASAPALRARTGRAPEELSDDDPVWTLEAAYLAQLVTTCVLAYAPHRVVLGGGVLLRAGLLQKVRAEVVRQLGGYVPREACREPGVDAFLVPPALGQEAGLAGAFALAQEARS